MGKWAEKRNKEQRNLTERDKHFSHPLMKCTFIHPLRLCIIIHPSELSNHVLEDKELVNTTAGVVLSMSWWLECPSIMPTRASQRFVLVVSERDVGCYPPLGQPYTFHQAGVK
eukprot:scaffold84414_cov84-Cyclotella_meneghiniana.AAC.1